MSEEGMFTDLVIECPSQIGLARIKRALSKTMSVTAVIDQTLDAGPSRRSIKRLHVKLSDKNNTKENLREAAALLLEYVPFIRKTMDKVPDTTGYLLVTAPCGTRKVFARSIVIEDAMLRVLGVCGMSVVVSAFPVEDVPSNDQ